MPEVSAMSWDVASHGQTTRVHYDVPHAKYVCDADLLGFPPAEAVELDDIIPIADAINCRKAELAAMRDREAELRSTPYEETTDV